MADSLEVMKLGRSLNDRAGAPGARQEALLGLRGQQKKGTVEISSTENSLRLGDTVGARRVHGFHDLVEIFCVFAVTELLYQTWKYVLIMSYVPIGEAVIMPERSSPFENSPSGQSYWLGNEFGVIGLSERCGWLA
ncbi:hypothetical protein OIU79_030974 [Salix purpurea]|uniref:Uncharacterized protein n=1 Tax=Salix purpurea TaxID=77065 RepID=A0A9Q0V9T6_SALPP|nr:hypothetical protein OIU79_030974 [Salix purpurea]